MRIRLSRTHKLLWPWRMRGPGISSLFCKKAAAASKQQARKKYIVFYRVIEKRVVLFGKGKHTAQA